MMTVRQASEPAMAYQPGLGLESIADGLYRSSEPLRSQTIIADVLERVEAAGGLPNHFTTEDEGTDYVPFRARMTWGVGASWSSREYQGNQSSGAYSAASIGQVKSLAQMAVDAIVAGEGVEALLSLHDSDALGLLVRCKRVSLPVACAYATVYNCTAFRCRNGRVICSSCGGSGGRTISVTRYDNQNRSYHVNEWQTCHSCSGSGTHTCSTCGGTGILTYRAEVEGHADPSWDYVVRDGVPGTRMAILLGEMTFLELVGGVFPMTFAGVVKLAEDRMKSVYDGVAVATFVAVHGPTRLSSARGIGPSIRLFHPDPVLDELLQPMLTRLSNVKSLSRAKKFDVFYELVDHRLLDEMMVTHAANPKAEPALNFLKVTHHLVSASMAAELGGACVVIVEGICPRYSLLPWLLAALATGLALLIGGINRAPDLYYEVAACAGMGLGLVGALALTLTRRAKVPLQYRTPFQEWKPMFGALMFCGVVYQIAVNIPPDYRRDGAVLLAKANAFEIELLSDQRMKRIIADWTGLWTEKSESASVPPSRR